MSSDNVLNLNDKKTERAIRIFQTALEECLGDNIGPLEVFFAINFIGQMHVEAGLIKGVSRDTLLAVKRAAQVMFIKKYSKRPDLWQPKKPK